MLPIQNGWLKDGPLVPVEFTRQSSDGRITLVIEPGAALVQILWAMMLPTDLQEAREALRAREGIPGKNWMSRIGSWQQGEIAPKCMPELPEWAQAHGLSAVIWTALGPKFNGKESSPSAQEVIGYLKSLDGKKRVNAEQYIRCAPRQIDTEYRRRIEAVLGWSYRECKPVAI